MKSYKPIILHLVSISWGGSYDYTHNIHQNLVNNGYDSFISIAGRRIITPAILGFSFMLKRLHLCYL